MTFAATPLLELLDRAITPKEQAEAFHAENPDFYRELCRLALELRRRGRRHYGIHALFNVVRWHRAMTTTDPDWKVNNNFAPFYARLLMAQEPELAGFFDLRESRFDSLIHVKGAA